MNIEWLNEFLVIASSGSFNSASQLLFVTPSALTRHIQSLEKELKTALFERDSHHLKLTTAGISLLPAAREITIKFDKVRRTVSSTSSAPTDSLNIFVHYSDYTRELAACISEFNLFYPSVEISIHSTDDHRFANLLSSCQADIALEMFSFKNVTESVNYLPIGSRRMFIIMSDNFLSEDDKPDLKILERVPLVVPDTEKHEGLMDLIGEIEKENAIHITNILKTDSVESMFHAVFIKKGVALIPEQYLKDVPDGVKIVTLPELPPRPFVALYSSNNSNPNIARFIAFLKGYMNPQRNCD